MPFDDPVGGKTVHETPGWNGSSPPPRRYLTPSSSGPRLPAMALRPLQDSVAAVRRFNRFYTQHLGVLRQDWLDSPFSLTEARVLYEIKARGSTTSTDLGRDLDLDAGYPRRTLRRLERAA